MIEPELLAQLTPAEMAELDRLLRADFVERPWVPFPGSPQMRACESEADIIAYGGAAGGGKSDWLIGTAITQHERVLVVRREKAQTEGIVQRMIEIIGSSDGYNSQRGQWHVPIGSKPLVEFGGLDNPGDERRWQGRPHDALHLDEVTEMREHQVRFLLGWVRTSNPKIRPRVRMTFNPPTTVEGRWVLQFFGPWLDRKHPRPAVPGELRWFTTVKGQDVEVEDGRPFVLLADGTRDYDVSRPGIAAEDIVTPRSRTFFPARVTDNPVYMATGYVATLQAMPEPLRSQMLYGDFAAGIEDDPFQVIPTRWVEAAMARWKPRDVKPELMCIGIDVAQGGRDSSVISRRHAEMWFDELIVKPGRECVDGPTTAGFVIAAMRDGAPVNIDVFGVGAQVYGHLMQAQQQCIGVNFGDRTHSVDATGRWTFANVRSECWWRMREALDPAANNGIALPPDRDLLVELCSATWQQVGNSIKVCSREDIIERIGRSPDRATAVILALMPTPKWKKLTKEAEGSTPRMPYHPLRLKLPYNPLARR